MDDEHHIGVYDIKDPSNIKVVAFGKGCRDVVLDMKFSKNNRNLILATRREIYLASFQKRVKLRKVSFGKNKSTSLCIGFLTSCEAVVGLKNGKLAVINGGSVTKKIPGHKKIVFALTNNKKMTKLISGGADGKIIIWNNKLKPLKEIIINSDNFRSLNPKIRAISIEEETSRILVGTRGGEIIDIDINSNSKEYILNAHFSKELWGLATHPNKDEFVSVGEDCLLAKWSISEKTLKKSKKLKYQANTCNISPKGKLLAVGCKNGYTLILNYQNFSLIKSKRTSKKEITQTKFSPCGNFLACSSRDAKIYIYSTKKPFKRVSICKGHHSTVTHLDFSEDSSILMSNCTSYEILFFDVESGK